jgi:hypothetical protein
MAHKDNVKNAENAAKALVTPEVEVVEEVAPTLEEKTGHHTGVVQLSPKVEAAA